MNIVLSSERLCELNYPLLLSRKSRYFNLLFREVPLYFYYLFCGRSANTYYYVAKLENVENYLVGEVEISVTFIIFFKGQTFSLLIFLAEVALV